MRVNAGDNDQRKDGKSRSQYPTQHRFLHDSFNVAERPD
jgi:hypothetical protein